MMMACACASPIDAIEMNSRPMEYDGTADRGRDHAPDDAFGRLASLVTSNDRYLRELRALNARVESARAHLATNPSDPTLGRAYLDGARVRRSRVLALLGANRIAAREFLLG